MIHLVPSKIRETYFLRLAICSRFSEEEDMEVSWKEVKEAADEILQENKKEWKWTNAFTRFRKSLTDMFRYCYLPNLR